MKHCISPTSAVCFCSLQAVRSVDFSPSFCLSFFCFYSGSTLLDRQAPRNLFLSWVSSHGCCNAVDASLGPPRRSSLMFVFHGLNMLIIFPCTFLNILNNLWFLWLVHCTRHLLHVCMSWERDLFSVVLFEVAYFPRWRGFYGGSSYLLKLRVSGQTVSFRLLSNDFTVTLMYDINHQ